jgi:hypothetical protein
MLPAAKARLAKKSQKKYLRFAFGCAILGAMNDVCIMKCV